MRRLTVTLLVLLVGLLVADRAAAFAASRVVASQARTAGGLLSTPDVDIEGFPFLTQALRGRYDRVVVAAQGVPAGEVELERLDATLSGVRVPLGDVLSGSLATIPVDAVEARALVPYDQLSERAGASRRVVTPDGDMVRVTGAVDVLGRTLSAVAISRVELVEGDIVVTAESFEVGNQAADRLVTRALRDRLDLRVPIGTLPYGLDLTGVRVQPDGVVVLATATDTALSPT